MQMDSPALPHNFRKMEDYESTDAEVRFAAGLNLSKKPSDAGDSPGVSAANYCLKFIT